MLKTSVSVQIDEARQELREIRSELDAIKQIVAIRRREKAYWDIKYRLAALQFEKALIKHAYACLKGGFRPDQPRWQKRTPQVGVGLVVRVQSRLNRAVTESEIPRTLLYPRRTVPP